MIKCRQYSMNRITDWHIFKASCTFMQNHFLKYSKYYPFTFIVLIYISKIQSAVFSTITFNVLPMITRFKKPKHDQIAEKNHDSHQQNLILNWIVVPTDACVHHGSHINAQYHKIQNFVPFLL